VLALVPVLPWEGVALPVPLCLHCELRPGTCRLQLCAVCSSVKGIPPLYERTFHHDLLGDWWEQHLRRLTARAAARLPLVLPRRSSQDSATSA